MNDSILIILVERYEELYNLKHSQYSNLQRRDNIWEEIGSIMKQEGNICRERWTRIRDNYRKALNLRKTKSGQAASKIKAPKYNKELSFLVPFLNDEENRRSNVSSSEPEDYNIPNLYEPSPSTPITRNYGPSPSPPITRNFAPSPSSHTPFYSSNFNAQNTSSNNTSRRRHVSSFRNRSSNNETAASVLKQYLSSKEEQQTSASSTAYQRSDFDPLTDFFITMAKTVQTFPVHEQVKIKAEIFQIINRTEMRLATTTNLSLTPSYEMIPPSTVNTLSASENMFTKKPDSRKITAKNDTYLPITLTPNHPMLSTSLHTSHRPPSGQLMIHPNMITSESTTAASTSLETNSQQSTDTDRGYNRNSPDARDFNDLLKFKE